MQQSHSNLTPKIVGFIIILAVTATGAYFFLWKTIDKDAVASTGTQSTIVATTPTTTAADASASPATATGDTSTSSSSSGSYKAGTYSTTVSYMVPHGSNSISVDITVDSSGAISKVADDHSYADNESGWYIESFDSALTGAVVGQKIDTLSLSRLGGASLTTNAFDNALSDITVQAQA